MILNIEKDGFRMDSTEGFTQKELNKMNAELEQRLQDQGVDPDNPDEYYLFVKNISEQIFNMFGMEGALEAFICQDRTARVKR